MPLLTKVSSRSGSGRGANRQLRNGGAAALQHLAERHLGCRLSALVVPLDQEGVLEELRHPEMLAREILEEALEVQLVKAMHVQVHQPRHDHHVRAVDDGVRTAAVAPADEGHLVAGEDDVAVGYVCVPARPGVVTDDPVGVLDPRCLGHCSPHPLDFRCTRRAALR